MTDIIKVTISNDDCFDHWNKKNSVKEWRINGKKRTKTIEKDKEIETILISKQVVVERKVTSKENNTLKSRIRWYDNGKLFSEETDNFLMYFNECGRISSILDKTTQSRLVVYGTGGVNDVVLETRLKCGLLHGYHYQFGYSAKLVDIVNILKSGNRLTYSFDANTGIMTIANLLSLCPERVETTHYQHGTKVSRDSYKREKITTE
jgi:hypothetical protein